MLAYGRGERHYRHPWGIGSGLSRPGSESGRQGDTDVAYEISERGKAQNCRIAKSSGTPELDEAACRLILQRAIFIPASDGAGGAKRTEGTTRIVWRRPNF